MARELNCFYFPYFVIPDELLKLGILYYDKIYIDTPSEESINVILDNLPRKGHFAKYAIGDVLAIQRVLKTYHKQSGALKASGLLEAGIVVNSTYGDRLDSLPDEVVEKISEKGNQLTCNMPDDLTDWLMRRNLRVWQMAGSYHWFEKWVDGWPDTYPRVSSTDMRMPIEVEERFNHVNLPEAAAGHSAR